MLFFPQSLLKYFGVLYVPDDENYDGNPSLRAKISSSSHSQLIAFSALLVRSPKLPFIPLAASVAATDFKATRDGEVAE